MGGLRLVHDVLDAQLVDRRQEKIGRVDALLLEQRDGEPLRVAAIVIGGAARAERIGGWMVWLRRVAGAVGRRREERVSRIPFAAVRRIADTIELDVDGCTLESGHLERRLAGLVRKLPGATGAERK